MRAPRTFKRILALRITLLLAALTSTAHQPPNPTNWGDQGNGLYTNPVMPGDFSDLDAIRVGTDYYAISSTMQYSPGMAVLHSSDLVNWQIAGHVVQDLREIGPELNWDRMNRSGHGIWAGAIRYHAGKYWVYFTTPDEGLFMSTATQAAGPWTPLKAVWRVNGWDDPCPFWDDDGQLYLVITNFANKYNIHLFKLTADGEHLIAGSDRIIHQSQGSEANKLYKSNGLYYHFYSEVQSEGRVAMMERSRQLTGPWETRQLNHVNPKVDKEPNQGGFIQIPSGAWYFVTHQGTGDWEGRAGVLLPVTWVNGWPVPGRVDAAGIGNMLWSAPKPIAGYPRSSLWTSDNFSEESLRPEWEWRYQPRGDKWSLREHTGHLRMQAFPALRKDDFQAIGNVLSQRSMRTAHNEVTVAVEVAGMADGQHAGLAHYATTYCALEVRRDQGAMRLTMNSNGITSDGPAIHQQRIWLRSTWDFSGISYFAYSLDGKAFVQIGAPYALKWGAYRGDRIGLFTVNDESESGYVDWQEVQYLVAQ